MSRLLPFKSEPTQKPDGARVLSLEDEATDEALSALSSQTARQVLSLIYEEPRTPPEIRDEIGSSLQNVHYHLENLEEAGLIRPAGSGYSEKGTEMNVYAPANEAVVLFAGQQQDRSRLKTALSRLIGGVGALALASYVIDRLGRTGSLSPQSVPAGGSADGGDSGAPPPETTAEGAQLGGDGGGDGGGIDTPTSGATDTTSDGGGIGIMDAGTDTPTPESIGTPTPTGTPAPSSTPQGTPTATAQPTPTATPQPTASPTSAPTQTPTLTEAPTQTPAPTETPAPTVATETPLPETVASAGDGGFLADPAVTFFLGGVFMLVLLTVWWYYQG